MLIALWEKIKAMARNFSDNMGEAIRVGDTKHIAGGIFCLGLTALGCLGIAVGIRNFAVVNANFLFTWVGLPVFAGWGLVCVLSSPKLGDIGEKTVFDPAVLRAKAEEMYALMRDVGYLILRDVSDYLGDMELSEAIQAGATLRRVEEVDTTDEQGHHQKKAIVKGARLNLYPPGFNIYRFSRGIKRPEIWQTTEAEAQEIIGDAPLTYEKTISVTDGAGEVKNIINYRQYGGTQKG